ncbi:YagK/YfjJ domain-containing protein [Acinetobacter sp. ANC 4641]|uniref:YagK/YfjJ domain-containing protein n=1 Tax=Acinetobacter sp. ANC 4641 TaxID=2529847 RepID=UPI0013F170F4|nr:inovirus-type Gp2 protein [Acinetobacter sp. ANC 4641]
MTIPACHQSQLLTRIDKFIFSVLDGSLTDAGMYHFLIQTIPCLTFDEDSSLWSYAPSITLFADLVAPLQAEYRAGKSMNVLLTGEHIRQIKRDILASADLLHQDIQEFRQSQLDHAKGLQTYMCQLFSHYNRLLLLRIDLGLQQAQYPHLTMRDLSDYLNLLRNRFANKDRVFEHLQGYVWAIEEGAQKGPHAHLLLLFDGNKHQDDYGLACKIRSYWAELTRGHGTLFSCNEKEYKAKMQQLGILGIGMIERTDQQAIFKAIHAAEYLTCPDKYLQRIKGGPANMRRFGKGQFKNSKRRDLKQTLEVAQQLEQAYECSGVSRPLIVRSG